MSRVYKGIIGACDKVVPSKLRPLWEHPAGPKTVFFWAPMFKWGLVIAGLGDINRPADKLSIPQSTSLVATGLIWSRYSVVIIPVNYNLLSVNLFVFITNAYQLFRALAYQQSLKTAGLVIAGLGDMQRPVQNLSVPQTASLAATGLIWSRYSLVIIPKNYSLFSVNVFVAATSLYQLSRAYRYQQSLKTAETK